MAREFTDAEGRGWRLRLTLGSLARVRETTGIELGKLLAEPDQLAAIVYGSPAQLGQLLWGLCEPQAQAAGVTPEEFADGFDRAALDAATDMLLAAVADFTLRPTIGREALEAVRRVIDRADETAAATIRAKVTEFATTSGTAGS